MESPYSPFIEKLKSISEKKELFRITFSKPRQKGDLLNIKVSPYNEGDNILYQVNYIYKNKEEFKNFAVEDLWVVLSEVESRIMFLAAVQTAAGDFQLLQNKKSSKIILAKSQNKIEARRGHDKQKKYLISADRPYLKELGITSFSGNLLGNAQKKYRQINKYVETIHNLIKSDLPATFSIADMGCGKGYLSFALYDFLTSLGIDTTLIGYEIREDIVEKSNKAAKVCGFNKLFFETGDIQNIDIQNIDMVIALHACDIATDMAIHKGINADAKYIVVSPCCQKQLRKDMEEPSNLSPMLKHGIFKERMAEMLTDAIRSLFLESHGYDTKVFEFISSEHTSKNLMITAVKGQGNKFALKHIESLKAQFGVKHHYLEDIIN